MIGAIWSHSNLFLVFICLYRGRPPLVAAHNTIWYTFMTLSLFCYLSWCLSCCVCPLSLFLLLSLSLSQALLWDLHRDPICTILWPAYWQRTCVRPWSFENKCNFYALHTHLSDDLANGSRYMWWKIMEYYVKLLLHFFLDVQRSSINPRWPQIPILMPLFLYLSVFHYLKILRCIIRPNCQWNWNLIAKVLIALFFLSYITNYSGFSDITLFQERKLKDHTLLLKLLISNFSLNRIDFSQKFCRGFPRKDILRKRKSLFLYEKNFPYLPL